MQQVTPYLWFDNQAEEAAKFYVSVFKNARLGQVSYYGEAGQDVTGQAPGSVMSVEFAVYGQRFVALNGGKQDWAFNESISFMVTCETQEEIDAVWDKLSADPKAEQCGWLKDKYGLSWQIVPSALAPMLADPDPAKSQPVTKAMLRMKKLDIAELVEAYGSAPTQKLVANANDVRMTTQSAKSPGEPVEFGSWAKILIVEDNVALADVYKTKMELIGYICFVAYEGNEALTMIEKEQPSLVLLDLMVPGVAGDQILRRMRSSEWGKDIKVLVISNLNEADAPAGLRNQGIEGYAIKANLTDDQLDQMVNKIMDRTRKDKAPAA